MHSSAIDFTKIRPHNGSQNGGFEELCAQIARLTERSRGSSFVRTGRGADAGVECYAVNNDLTEKGWQAKYVFSWDDGLASQLDKSINAALNKHPKLTEYTICIPFNLPDARQKNRKSQREKWNDWKSKWEAKAKGDGRDLLIDLWDATAICAYISVDKPEFSGRLYYWFSKLQLTPDWFIQSFNRAKSDLGSRYTPESNIELPIRKAFAGCARVSELNKTIQKWMADILDEVSSINSITNSLPDDQKRAPPILEFNENLSALSTQLQQSPFDLTEKIPVKDWQASITQARTAVTSLLYWVYEIPDENENGKTKLNWDYVRVKLRSLGDRLAEIFNTLESDEWRLANADAVMLSGEAGTGKSHLLADVVEHQVHGGRPALLALGSYLVDGDPWEQILRIFDLPSTLRTTDFLGALDAAGESAHCRVLLCIDAINERNGTSVWPDRIGSFLKLAESFPRVVVVLSCRTTYLPRMVPSAIADGRLTAIEHDGFAAEGGHAANLYLAKRGIVRAGAPNLAPEMHIPLFLKTLCDALDSRNQREIPRGLDGISALFEFYNSSVIDAITRKLNLDPRLKHVKNAVSAFANLLAERGESYASYPEVNALFETILQSQGSMDRGLLPHLESEGLLSVEVFSNSQEDARTDVRFTFERYSDHIIATYWLNRYLDKSRPLSSFRDGTALGTFLFGDGYFSRAGVIEAIAVQLPEICGLEIVDLGRECNWAVSMAFEKSLLWRDQRCFSEKTMQLAQKHFESDECYDLLVQIATEPRNQFNANYLNDQLSPLTLPDRDEAWSAWLMHQNESGDAAMILIDWALRNGQEYISEDRAELAAITLTWFLSCSNREIRDKSTKALTSLLATRLSLAAKLLERFAAIDDLFVLERLLAGVYGAVLQGKNQDEIRPLASTVFETIFASGTPPLNELLRDHARCILDYAAFHSELPSKITSQNYAPPYQSSWPIEHVSDELIEGYKQDYNGAYLRDDIVSSCVSDGDFARYIIDPFVVHFGVNAPDESDSPSHSDLAHDWIQEFIDKASEAQMNALCAVLSAAEKLEGKAGYGESSEHRDLKAANSVLKELLTNDEWGEYRAMACCRFDGHQDRLIHATPASRSKSMGLL